MKFKAFFRIILAGGISLLAFSVNGQTSIPDISALKASARAFLEQQLIGQPGEVKITLNDPDPHVKLTACNHIEPFLPRGAKLKGRTLVGIRCEEPKSWQLIISADIRIRTTVWVANHALPVKTVIKSTDLRQEAIDITGYPAPFVTQTEQIVGKILNRPISPNIPIFLDAVQNNDAVAAGEIVRVECIGQGFKVGTEGKAISNVIPGQTAQIRLQSGQIITGTMKSGKIVEVKI